VTSKRSHLALNDVSFEIADGEFLAVIGHTGSGKSTLVQHMNGLLLPTSGRVTVNGLDLADRNARQQVRRIVGMAFQYPESQLFAETVAEDVAFGPRNLGMSPDEVERCVRGGLAAVALDYDRYADRSPFSLSGGERRRVALAGIIAMEPSVVVLDEPTAGLDPAGREEILGFLECWHAKGTTIVMVSHSMEDVAAYADRVLVLKDGAVFLHGTPAEVFAHAVELHEIGLGVPFAHRFAACLRERGVALPKGILTGDDLANAILAGLGREPHERPRRTECGL
jgi:energy-coupling factor transport system ATP-binding protein